MHEGVQKFLQKRFIIRLIRNSLNLNIECKSREQNWKCYEQFVSWFFFLTKIFFFKHFQQQNEILFNSLRPPKRQREENEEGEYVHKRARTDEFSSNEDSVQLTATIQARTDGWRTDEFSSDEDSVQLTATTQATERRE